MHVIMEIITIIAVGLLIIMVIDYFNTKSNNTPEDNIQQDADDSKWWTIGMLADLYNKSNDKKK